MRIALFLISVGWCVPVCPNILHGQTLYTTAGNDVWRRNLPGGEATSIFTGSYDGRPMWIESDGRSLYWSAYSTGELWTSGLDGQGARVLTQTPSDYPRGIQLYANRVYWCHDVAGKIFSVDMNGNDLREVYSGPGGYYDGPNDIEIYNGRIYWTSWDSGMVRTCAMDGTDYRSIVARDTRRAMSIEIYDETIYVGDDFDAGPGVASIRAYSMDGQSYVVMATGRRIHSMDVFDRRIYYNDATTNQICSVALSGGPERIEYDAYSWQLTVTPEPSSAILVLMGLAAAVRRRRR